MTVDPPVAAGYALLSLLMVGGVFTLWRGLRPGGFARRPVEPAAMPPWIGNIADLCLLFLLAIIGAILFPNVIAYLFRRWWLDHYQALQVFMACGSQLGLLMGIGAYARFWKPFWPQDFGDVPQRSVLYSGGITFLSAFPLVMATAALWQGLLQALGYPLPHQTVVDLFLGLNSLEARGFFLAFAIILAPFNEELLFRGAIFRYLRGRVPRWAAIGGSAVLFGAAHLLDPHGAPSFLPLVVLGAIFAVAYERTGRIGTTMVAHALFNVTTIVALLLGVNT